MIRLSAAVFTALLVSHMACPPGARAVWRRYELAGLQMGNAYVGGKLADFAIYNQRYGFGIGTTLLEGKLHGWDVQRTGLSDASGHGLGSFVPISAYLGLWSWQGPPFFFAPSYAEHTLGKLELYLTYSGWARLTQFTEAQPNILGELERMKVGGGVGASYLDYGLRLDAGSWAALSVGRLDFKTRSSGAFQSRRSSQWYALLHLYGGGTFTKTAGGGAHLLVKDAYHLLRQFFHRVDKDDYIRED